FPSDHFYAGALGNGVTAEQREAPWHLAGAPPPSSPTPTAAAAAAAAAASPQPLAPLVVWDVQRGRESGGGGGAGGSLRNLVEAEAAAALLEGLMRVHPSFCGTVAVISPYTAQVHALRAAFQPVLRLLPAAQRKATADSRAAEAGARPGEAEAATHLPEPLAACPQVDFSTVDGYQGREADIVIFSCVRANNHQASGAAAEGSDAAGDPQALARAVGFLQDVRRMNVALTRARFSLWVLGHARTLAVSHHWRALLASAKERRYLLPTQALGMADMRDQLRRMGVRAPALPPATPLPRPSQHTPSTQPAARAAATGQAAAGGPGDAPTPPGKGVPSRQQHDSGAGRAAAVKLGGSRAEAGSAGKRKGSEAAEGGGQGGGGAAAAAAPPAKRPCLDSAAAGGSSSSSRAGAAAGTGLGGSRASGAPEAPDSLRSQTAHRPNGNGSHTTAGHLTSRAQGPPSQPTHAAPAPRPPSPAPPPSGHPSSSSSRPGGRPPTGSHPRGPRLAPGAPMKPSYRSASDLSDVTPTSHRPRLDTSP
ncbi:hypothetical protein QJQ45_016051, partial [Haematococcus lacustris]